MIVATAVDDESFLPRYGMPGDAGADLRTTESVRIEPGERVLVGTGVRVALPEGHVGFVTPRSGLAARVGLSIVNSPGVVDAGYRGEIKVNLINLDRHHAIDLVAGDRIAQLVVLPFVGVHFEPVTDLDETLRGEGGYGSTGFRDAATADKD